MIDAFDVGKSLTIQRLNEYIPRIITGSLLEGECRNTAFAKIRQMCIDIYVLVIQRFVWKLYDCFDIMSLANFEHLTTNEMLRTL